MSKFQSKLLLSIMASLMALFLVACGSDDDDDDDSGNNAQPTMNVVETAVADGSFTTLVTALQAAGLDDDLAGPGPFTVFAPTDDAFALLPAGTVDSLLDPANQATLIDLLSFHVISGRVSEEDALALNGTGAEMLNGTNLRIDEADGVLTLSLNGKREATVIFADIETTNGVIHVIDVVLDPGDAVVNIVETAVANGSFTTLVTALQAAGLDDDLAGPGPFTVFAPTDDAFNNLPAGTIDTLLDPANQALLIDILTYHVFNGSVLSPAAIALDDDDVTMLNGDDLDFDVVGGELILNLGGVRQATVILTDVLTSNGVIHVIDTVLDPEDDDGDDGSGGDPNDDPNDDPQPAMNIVETAVADGRFTTLVAALQAAGLDDDLAGNGPFTVFAPTDDAFGRLPAGTVETLLEPANQNLLIDILTYHVISGSVFAADAIALDGDDVTMLNEDDVDLDVVGGELILNLGGLRQATVIQTDVVTSNGVIHVIDTVLDPEDDDRDDH